MNQHSSIHKLRVWLITGGLSAERPVSLDSGAAVARTLLAGGHRVLAYDSAEGRYLEALSSPGACPAEAPPTKLSWSEKLLWLAPRLREAWDVAFIAVHGGEGEDGTLPVLLELAGLPYTGSGPTACALTLDKVLTKLLMRGLGIATPAWEVLDVPDPARPPARADLTGPCRDGWPVVIKPIVEGSSVGVAIPQSAAEWPAGVRLAAEAARASLPHRRQPVSRRLMVEEYIAGQELTVSILSGRALPVIEIVPRRSFYDYERKYTAGETLYKVPAPLPEALTGRLQREALTLYTAAGCGGMARIDYRLAPGGEPQCLELNTVPGLTETSLVPKAAAAAGLDFLALLEAVCRDAAR